MLGISTSRYGLAPLNLGMGTVDEAAPSERMAGADALLRSDRLDLDDFRCSFASFGVWGSVFDRTTIGWYRPADCFPVDVLLPPAALSATMDDNWALLPYDVLGGSAAPRKPTGLSVRFLPPNRPNIFHFPDVLVCLAGIESLESYCSGLAFHCSRATGPCSQAE